MLAPEESDGGGTPQDPGHPESEEESAARRYCLTLLGEDSACTYHDARRLGKREGVKVTRRIWSAARREALGEEETDELENGAPPSEPAPGPESPGAKRPPEPPTSERRAFPPEPAAPEAPPPRGPRREQRAEPRPPFENPHLHPRTRASRGNHDARRGRDREDSPRARDRWESLFGGDDQGLQDLRHERPPRGEPRREARPGEPGEELTPPPPERPRAPQVSPLRGGRPSAVEFMAEVLREEPDATYRQVRERAENEGYIVSAAAFGRAQVIAGVLRPEAPGSSPRPPAARAAPNIPTPDDPIAHLQAFIEAFSRSARQTSGMRTALREMLQVVQKALHGPGADPRSPPAPPREGSPTREKGSPGSSPPPSSSQGGDRPPEG